MHNLRLFVLRNRFNILTSILAAAVASIIILQFVILIYIANSLRGLTCVLLILPEVRTVDSVSQCIDDNGGRNFNFSAPAMLEPVKSEKGEKGDPGYTPVKGVDYFDGANGTNGADGKDGQNGKDGKDGADGEPALPPPQLIIECIAGFFMSRYEGETDWKIIGEGCS